MYLIIPLVVCIAGLLLYAIATREPLREVGRIAFAVGLFVTVWQFAGHALTLTR